MKQTPFSTLPPFRPDGYLPEGVHVCSEAGAVSIRLIESSSPATVLRLRRWIEVGAAV